jgi:hypothetical protein
LSFIILRLNNGSCRCTNLSWSCMSNQIRHLTEIGQCWKRANVRKKAEADVVLLLLYFCISKNWKHWFFMNKDSKDWRKYNAIIASFNAQFNFSQTWLIHFLFIVHFLPLMMNWSQCQKKSLKWAGFRWYSGLNPRLPIEVQVSNDRLPYFFKVVFIQ